MLLAVVSETFYIFSVKEVSGRYSPLFFVLYNGGNRCYFRDAFYRQLLLCVNRNETYALSMGFARLY